tara:strand:+ start:288 stop:473 length:186 start_codon:yes stop_codon:yes gene_type:complete
VHALLLYLSLRTLLRSKPLKKIGEFKGPTKQLMELRYANPYLSIHPIKLEDSESSNPVEIH